MFTALESVIIFVYGAKLKKRNGGKTEANGYVV
jgi:hypothetical protein